MYHIVDRSDERIGGHSCSTQEAAPALNADEDTDFVLQMQQNRSSFPQEARGTFAVLVTLLMATSILPAFKGHMLVPLFSLGVMALLVWALESHQKTAPYSERLELTDGELRYVDSAGRTFAMPSYWVRLETVKRTPVDVRLALRSRDRRFEFGSSLNLEERLAIRPVIEHALATAKGL
ncbi:MAG: DUF2244 domain-containing protein [Sphingorhabdus sp.]